MAWLPPLRGTIDRRILVNFRIDPDALRSVLPDPFEPRTVDAVGANSDEPSVADAPEDAVAIGGVCCLRLADVRPRGLPAAVGIGAESAAHRIGVEWEDESGERRSGVYVPRRDTSSRLVAFVGDRTFGRHERADFTVSEADGRYALTMESHRDGARIHFDGTVADDLPDGSVFPAVESAVAYHQCGIEGYSPSPDGARMDCLAMEVDEWAVRPLAIDSVEASFFDDRLPDDAVTFDNALLMADVGVGLGRRTPLDAADDGPTGG